MSSTRSTIAPPVFALNALTVIPPTPVAGVSYRDATAGPASSPDGWPYAERVNSAEWNQLVYQWSTLLSIMDKKGVLGWSALVDYTESSVQFGSDGILYSWLAASGPNNGGAKDPISNPTFWIPFRASGSLINTRVFNTPGSIVYTPSPGTKSVIVEVQGAGGGGGGAAAVAAGSVSGGGGGGGGGYSKSVLPVASVTGQTITVGAGGAVALAAAGSNGGASSIGAIITATGGVGGGLLLATSTFPAQRNGEAGGQGAGGSVHNSSGAQGDTFIATSATNGISGKGGSSQLSAGGPLRTVTGGGTGGMLGSGGGGALVLGLTGTNYAGGAGGNGIVIIWEFS